jgi:Transglutaminase-like superfamily
MQRDWISIGDELEVPGRIRLGDVANVVAAFVWARGSLSLRPFLTTVESVRTKKSHGGGTQVVGDILDLAARVDVFRRLRPFLFAAEDRCLLHALTLVRFLSRYGFYPEWVIGVATQPWGAHSWVQWGDFLLDSNPEKVCRYTPIMMV